MVSTYRASQKRLCHSLQLGRHEHGTENPKHGEREIENLECGTENPESIFQTFSIERYIHELIC